MSRSSVGHLHVNMGLEPQSGRCNHGEHALRSRAPPFDIGNSSRSMLKRCRCGPLWNTPRRVQPRSRVCGVRRRRPRRCNARPLLRSRYCRQTRAAVGYETTGWFGWAGRWNPIEPELAPVSPRLAPAWEAPSQSVELPTGEGEGEGQETPALLRAPPFRGNYTSYWPGCASFLPQRRDQVGNGTIKSG